MWTGHSERRSDRQAGHNCAEELEQLVRSLSPLNAAHSPTQSEGRGDGGEAGGRDVAGVSTIERIEQDGEKTVAQHMRPLAPFSAARVHTEGGRVAVGRDAVGDVSNTDMTGSKTGESNHAEVLGPLTLPLPPSPEAVVRTEGGMYGRGHSGGVPGLGVEADSQRLLSASGSVSSCSPLTSLGKWLTVHQLGRMLLSFVCTY